MKLDRLLAVTMLLLKRKSMTKRSEEYTMSAQKPDRKPVGLTKNTGYQIGVRRTLPFSRDRIGTFWSLPSV